jgi:Spy/CpxP family protein refolding chaperone
MLRSRALVGLCLLLTAGSSTAAQGEGEKSQDQLGFFGLRGMMGAGALTDEWARLMRLEQVRKELEITPEQLDKLKKIAQKATERLRRSFADMQGLRDAGPDQRKAEFAEWTKKARTKAEETKKEIESVLRPHQIARLRQITIQVRGAAALEDKGVQEELRLTDEQKKRLKSLQSRMGERLRGTGLPASDEERKALREKLQAARNERDGEALGILTAEQKAEFEKMKGPKFDIDHLLLRSGGHRTP